MLCLFYAMFLLAILNHRVNSFEDKASNRCSYCFQRVAIYIYRYKGRYLSRRIPYASRGGFNPYVISNKEAHIIYGNIYDDKVTKYKTTTISEQSQQGTNERRYFMNYCLTHPGKFHAQ